MGFHHLAFATNDMAATHAFYTDVMGFRLAKTVVNETPDGGWAKHVFYDTGDGEYIAFWELHDDTIGPFNASISDGLGLPAWVNHIAFRSASEAELSERRDALVASGHIVVEIDHGFCRSVYLEDPNKILVELCTVTGGLDENDAIEAARLLADPAPLVEPAPSATIHGLPPKPPTELFADSAP
jgi:catechol 2,3-dioxygenase-like lactoylglutathione lyase family enzyme